MNWIGHHIKNKLMDHIILWSPAPDLEWLDPYPAGVQYSAKAEVAPGNSKGRRLQQAAEQAVKCRIARC